MGFFADKQAEANALMLNVLTPLVAPGETLVGAVFGNHQKAMSANLYVIGVTSHRLVLVPVDRKWAPKGPAISIAPTDIVNSSVWGWGGGFKEFMAANSGEQIRIETAAEKFKFMITGGNIIENKLAGEHQVRGLDALIEFLLASKTARGA